MELMVLPFSRYFTGAFVSPSMKRCWQKEGDKDESAQKFLLRTFSGEQIYIPKNVCLGGDAAHEEWQKVISYMPEYFKSLPHQLASLNYHESSDALLFFNIEDASQRILNKIASKKMQSFWQQVIRFQKKEASASHFLEGQIFVHRNFSKVFSKGQDVFASIEVLEQELRQLKTVEGLTKEQFSALTQWQTAIGASKTHNLPLIKNIF